MPFLLYERRPRDDGATEFLQLQEVSLAGTTSGLIHPFVRQYGPPRGIFPWHATVRDLLAEAGIHGGNRSVVIDTHPKGSVYLYELTDVWGYSYAEWTPIGLRLETLCEDVAAPHPSRFKLRFADRGAPRTALHEMLQLKGGTEGGSWTWGSVGSVNGVKLPPDALAYFVERFAESLDRPHRGEASS